MPLEAAQSETVNRFNSKAVISQLGINKTDHRTQNKMGRVGV